MTRDFVHRLRARYVECDMQGIVFNAHYYTWMDVAHTELLREAFGPLSALQALGVDFVVAESSARYLASARFDDQVDVAVVVESLGTTSMITRFDFARADGVLVEGRVRHVCVDSATWTKAPWPDPLRAAFTTYLGG